VDDGNGDAYSPPVFAQSQTTLEGEKVVRHGEAPGVVLEHKYARLRGADLNVVETGVGCRAVLSGD